MRLYFTIYPYLKFYNNLQVAKKSILYNTYIIPSYYVYNLYDFKQKLNAFVRSTGNRFTKQEKHP